MSNYYQDILDKGIKSIEEDLNDLTEIKEPSTIDTGWKNAPTIEDLKIDLSLAQPNRDERARYIAHWDSLRNPEPIKRNTNDKNSPEKSTHRPKLIRKMAEWRYASMSEPFLNNSELFAVQPVTWEDREKANKSAILLNHQFRKELNLTKFIDDYIRTLVDEGMVILKPAWISQYETKKEPVYEYILQENMDPEFEEVLQEALYYYNESPSEYITKIPESLKRSVEVFLETGNVFEFVQRTVGFEDVQKLTVNKPDALVLSAKDVYIDPSAESDYKKAKFIIYKFKTCMADLIADGRYQNLDAIDVNNLGNLLDENSITTYGNFEDSARRQFDIYEYWGYYDIEGNNVLQPIVATWAGDTLIRMELSPYSDGLLPIIAVQYMPVKNSIDGEPDAVLLEENQEINGAIMRGIIDVLARNANGQRGVPKGMLDNVNFVRFQKGQDFQYNSGDPKSQIYVGKFEDIPVSAFNVLSLIQSDSEALTGVKNFHQGLNDSSFGRVATSVRGVMAATSQRETNILRRAAEGLEELGRRFLSMSSDFLEEEEIIRITNERFEVIHRDEIAGKYDIQLNITTAEETTTRSQELAFMMQTMVPSLDLSISMILLEEYARLNKMPDLAHRIKTYQPEPDPMVEQMRLLELQEAYLRVEQAKLNLDSTIVDQALTEARAMHEQAKAANVQSVTDKNTLDYVEQEGGIKHQRDVERIQSQALGNIALEERKSQLRAAEGRQKVLDEYLDRRTFGDEE